MLWAAGCVLHVIKELLICITVTRATWKLDPLNKQYIYLEKNDTGEIDRPTDFVTFNG